ncbi:UDP-glucuronosyl/UDP-glucosyltransferase [Cinara cedri]|uniref:UDP-glucuronosyltransferase n=1 Tax=Cinara cedri TaxID=506608 RepID=A0A5E4NM30_9HEMI|nr:UDP-glucuronosyl/UDP-glucosyltransferase [Cinara cedri]
MRLPCFGFAYGAISGSYMTAVFIVLGSLSDTLFGPAQPARILAIETIAGKSHWNFMSSVLRALTENGHSVTAYTPFPDGDRDNYTEVDTSDSFAKLVGVGLTELVRKFGNPFIIIPIGVQMNRHTCEMLYGDGRWRLGENRSSEFDAIIVEPSLLDCVTYVANVLDIPLIYCVPTPVPTFVDGRAIGDVLNPAAVSQLWADRAVPKTFFDRLANTVTTLYLRYVVAYKVAVLKAFEPRPYDADVAVPPSLVFVNGHYVSDPSRPMSQNVKNVGGIHLKPAQKLPKDILEFIEGSPHGVILFTFGSTVLMSSIPNHIKNAFLEALSHLPQRVLLKYEDELEDKPNNVMTRKWFPQRDILLHPKVKLFVSHGGISGVYETVDAGVPVLGFPLFIDQHRNIDNLVEAGMAISMDILSVSKDTFLKNVVELINDGKYKKNAKIASDIFKDRPMSPQQSVVYWTEYVIRHKGAPHFKSQAHNLTWYQYLLLDVISVLLISIAIFSFVIFVVFKIVHQYLFKRSYTIQNKSE